MIQPNNSYFRFMGWFMVSLYLLFPSFEIKSESITYEAEIPWTDSHTREVQMENGQSYTIVSFSNSINDVEPGKPDIPYLEYGFLVPDGAGNFQVSIKPIALHDFVSFDYPLIPAQFSWSINDLGNKPFLDSNSQIYTSANAQPSAKIVDEIYVNAQHHVVKVAIPTMEYFYAEKKAKLLSKVEIILHYQNGVQPNLALVNPEDTDSYKGMEDIVVNCPKMTIKKETKSSVSLNPVSSDWYYIITPQVLVSSATKIGDWKKQKGYNVKVTTVEEILSSPGTQINGTSIKDEAEAIRTWLISERKTVGRFYLLLIGDARINSPIRKLRNASKYNAASVKNWHSDHFLPTDGYFSDLTTNYNLTKEIDGHYSAFVEQTTYSPDLMVGRILASKNKEVETYLNKLLTYEVLPAYNEDRYDYLNKGLVTKQFQHRNYTSLFNNVPDFPYLSILKDSIGYTDYTKSTPTGAQVIEAMKESGLISLMGHGTPTTLTCAGGNKYPGTTTSAGEEMRYIQSLDSYGPEMRWIKREEPDNGLDLLRNKNKPSVIYTLSCDIMPFDSLFNYSNLNTPLPYNMAEAFTVAGDFGGVAFIGNTRTGWDTHTQRMELSFGTQINNNVPIGMAFNYSTSATNYRFSQYTRNLIGDPEMKIWIGMPKSLDIHSASNSNGLYMESENLINSKIVVYDGSKDPIVYRIEDNVDNLFFNTEDYGKDFMVSVYKDKYVPNLQLFAQNSLLTISKHYTLTKCFLKGVNDHSYKIKQDGLLSLECLDNFESDRAFEISEGGCLNIESRGSIKLSNDKISDGGKAVLTGGKIELKSGFTVSKGGTITVTTK